VKVTAENGLPLLKTHAFFPSIDGDDSLDKEEFQKLFEEENKE
jgi:hypothetical protein